MHGEIRASMYKEDYSKQISNSSTTMTVALGFNQCENAHDYFQQSSTVKLLVCTFFMSFFVTFGDPLKDNTQVLARLNSNPRCTTLRTLEHQYNNRKKILLSHKFISRDLYQHYSINNKSRRKSHSDRF